MPLSSGVDQLPAPRRRRLLLNSLSLLEHLDVHPAADRLLTNLLVHAAGGTPVRSAAG